METLDGLPEHMSRKGTEYDLKKRTLMPGRGNKQPIPQRNVEKPKEVQEQIRPSSPSRQSAPPKMGPKSAQQMQRGRPVQKR